MASIKPPLVAFNGGEIGPETLARTDLENYTRCAAEVENIFLYPQGKMAKAPGTRYVGEAAAGDEVLIRPFEFSVNDNLILVLSDEALQIVSGCAFLTIEGAAATLAGWTDKSSAPSTGGGSAPPSGGGDGGGDLGGESGGVWSDYWTYTAP